MGHTIQQHYSSDGFWLYIGAIVGLIVFSGLMSGLTLGLMSLSLVDLEVIKRSGKPEDQKNAAKILPVVQNQHLLLVTLLVGNAVAMEALPLFLDSLVDTYIAIILSVTLLLMFGEILPQAVCSRYGLAVGAAAAPVVRLLLIILFPVAYPVSKLLDFILGEKHSILFGREELRTLVDMHSNEAGKGGELKHYETAIISGALSLTEKVVAQVMTPISKTFSVDVFSKLDRLVKAQILSSGHSRIPVFDGKPSNIVGVLLVKSLVSFDRPADDVLIADLAIRKIPRVSAEMPLYDILHEFQQGRSHMAAVVRYSCKKDLGSNPGTDCQYEVKKYDLANHHGSVLHTRVDKQQQSPTSNEMDDSQQRTAMNGKYRRRQPWISWADEEGDVVGIITLKDVFEELLQEEILNDKDCSAMSLHTTRIPEDQQWTPSTQISGFVSSLIPEEGSSLRSPGSPLNRSRSFSAPGSPESNASNLPLDAITDQTPRITLTVSAPGSPTQQVQRSTPLCSRHTEPHHPHCNEGTDKSQTW